MRRTSRSLMLALVFGAWALGGSRALLYAGIAAAAVELASLRFALVDLSRPRWRRPRPTPSPDALQRSFTQLRDELVTAGHSAREFDRGLRSRLTRVFALQLLERRGVRLHRAPDRARGLVDAQVWDLLDPGRPDVVDRAKPGVDRARLRHVLDELEAL